MAIMDWASRAVLSWRPHGLHAVGCTLLPTIALRWQRLRHACPETKPSGEIRKEGSSSTKRKWVASSLVQGFQGHSLYPIVAMATFTGMRRNEMLALRWVDIDLDAGMVFVSRNVEVTKAHGTRIVMPKSKHGHRQLKIDIGLVELLRKEQERAEFRSRRRQAVRP